MSRYVDSLPADAVIVSGGAAGPDTWAERAASKRGLKMIVHRPDLTGVRSRGEAAARYYARNQVVVDDCDVLAALPSPDRKGGTEDTIRRAAKAGKQVILL